MIYYDILNCGYRDESDISDYLKDTYHSCFDPYDNKSIRDIDGSLHSIFTTDQDFEHIGIYE